MYPFINTLLQGLLLAWSLFCPAAIASLDTDRYLHVFYAQEPVYLVAKAKKPPLVTLHNESGMKIASVQSKASHGRNIAIFEKLPPGYYEARAGRDTRAFVVLTDPGLRVPGPSRLAIDNAMSHTMDPPHFADVAYLLNKLGFGWVRERMNWEAMEPERQQYQTATRYDEAIDALAARKLDTYMVFHATPPWARADHDKKRPPDDLRDIYRFARHLAKQYRGKVKAWEVWNEPDIPFFEDSATELAAFQKAAYLGFRSVDAELPVLGPSMAFGRQRFAEHLLGNNLGEYFDIWNYHVYGKVETFRERATEFRKLLSEHGLKKPMWVTEAGLPAGLIGETSQTGRITQAAFLSRSLPESLAAGNDRHFWFLLPKLSFGRSDWGLFEADQRTPLPALATLSTVTYVLGQANYLGQITGLEKDVRAYLFDRGDGSRALALWREQHGKPPVRLPIDGNQVDSVLNMFGRSHPLPAGPVSLPLNQSAMFLLLKPGTLQDEFPAQPMVTAAPDISTQPSPVVVRLRVGDSKLDRELDHYQVKAGKRYPLHAELYNFGSQPVSLKLAAAGPAAKWLNADDTVYRIEPMQRRQIDLELKVDASIREGHLILRADTRYAEAGRAVVWMSTRGR